MEDVALNNPNILEVECPKCHFRKLINLESEKYAREQFYRKRLGEAIEKIWKLEAENKRLREMLKEAAKIIARQHRQKLLPKNI